MKTWQIAVLVLAFSLTTAVLVDTILSIRDFVRECRR
jgi:hypothetical protein